MLILISTIDIIIGGGNAVVERESKLFWVSPEDKVR
jgi:hypothetical protein